MDIRLNPTGETIGYEKFLNAIENSSIMKKYPTARYVEIICVKQLLVDNEMTDVCYISAIGLPGYPNWTHKIHMLCENGVEVKKIEPPTEVLDGVFVQFGKDRYIKTNQTI